MKLCTVCGMGKDANPAHGSDYTGVGKHACTYPKESKSIPDDIVVSFGGEMKSLEGGGFEGYLVRFSSADDPDLVGDYFTKSTEFFIEDGAVIPILYDHGLNATMKKTKIGRATVKYDDAGLFIKGELEVADQYQAFVSQIKKKLIDKGKAGLSSGAASHMVERKQVKKGVNEILSWGIAEGSVTPAATEPRCEVYSLKSYFDFRDDPLADETDEVKSVPDQPVTPMKAVNPEEEPEEALANGVKGSIKGLFEAKMKEKVPSVWEVRSTLDDVYRDIAMAKSIEDITGSVIDVEAKVKEAKSEAAIREVPLVVAQIDSWIDKKSKGNDEGSKYFYLRALPNTTLETDSIKGGLGNGLNLDEHSDRVVYAIEEFANLGASLNGQVKSYLERAQRKIEYRASDPDKPGRGLSQTAVEKLNNIKAAHLAFIAEMEELTKSIETVIAAADPGKAQIDTAEALQLQWQFARTQTELALSGAAV